SLLAHDGPVWPHETSGGGSPSEHGECQKCSGDPINTATGALTESATDLAVSGRGPGLSWSRTYDSQSSMGSGPMGYGWTGAYGMHLQVDPYSGSGTLATTPVVDVVQENGSQADFVTD